MDKNIEDEVEELQILEQNLQQLLMQKQVLQTQLLEIDSALEELSKDPKSVFKVSGEVMIESTREAVEKEFNFKKEMIDVKLKNITKQEDMLRQKVKEKQEYVLEHMKKNG